MVVMPADHPIILDWERRLAGIEGLEDTCGRNVGTVLASFYEGKSVIRELQLMRAAACQALDCLNIRPRDIRFISLSDPWDIRFLPELLREVEVDFESLVIGFFKADPKCLLETVRVGLSTKVDNALRNTFIVVLQRIYEHFRLGESTGLDESLRHMLIEYLVNNYRAIMHYWACFYIYSQSDGVVREYEKKAAALRSLMRALEIGNPPLVRLRDNSFIFICA